MDNDHRAIIEAIYTVSMATTIGGTALALARERLSGMVRSHFVREEWLLDKVGYTGLGRLHGDHFALLRSLDEALAGLEDDSPLPVDMMVSWFVDHICGEDMLYKSFVFEATGSHLADIEPPIPLEG